MKIRVEEYIRPDGLSPYAEWFDSLEAQAAAKVTTAKLRMELGNTSNVKWFAGIGEYVIDWGSAYRICLAKDGESLIVFFGGGNKRRQQSDRRGCACLFLRLSMVSLPAPARPFQPFAVYRRLSRSSGFFWR